MWVYVGVDGCLCAHVYQCQLQRKFSQGGVTNSAKDTNFVDES